MALIAYPFLSEAVFSDDDGYILQLAVDAPWWASYLVPEVYQQLSVVHYTPVVISVYRVLISLFGLNAAAFVLMQLFLFSLCTAMAATWCHRQTQQASAGGLVVLLMMGASSFWPMLVRFYTMHYLIGAIFSLGLLLLLQKAPAQKHPQEPAGPIYDSPLFYLSVWALGLAAVLSKEVYLLLLPAVIAWCLWQRQKLRATALSLSLLVYMALRLHVLGFSLDGRQGQSFVDDFMAINASTLVNFLQWYVQTHAMLLGLAILALWRSPQQLLRNTLVAGLLVLPVLAAPHAIRFPWIHADRLFFAFDLAMICAVALALHHKPWPKGWLKWGGLGVLAGSAWMGQAALAATAQKSALDEQQRVTRKILAAPIGQAITVLTDLTYQQGGLMRVMQLRGTHNITITQNCQLALTHQRQGETLWVFDGQGNSLDPAFLHLHCQLLPAESDPVTALIDPVFVNGVLKWHLQATEDMQVGVEFPDLAMIIPVRHMHQRLVRLRQHEPYRLFAHREGKWWFSELQAMQFSTSQP
jgi:hypothetical protein